MTRLTLLAAAALWFLSPSRGLAAFVSCEDAHNYGENTGSFYVAQTFARMDCDQALLDTIHNAISRMISSQVIETSDSNQEKLCFYTGLWDGLVAQLSSEYEACGAYGWLSCVDRADLASHAGAMLRAMSGAFDDDAVLNHGNVRWVYAIEDSLLSGVPLCGELPTASCATLVRDRAGPRVADRFGQFVNDIAETICN